MDTNEQQSMDTTVERANRRVLSGVVISDKMEKTVVVAVPRYVKHPKYQKFVKQMKHYKARDEKGQCREGDDVRIEECPPFSKDTKFRVIECLSKHDDDVAEEPAKNESER